MDFSLFPSIRFWMRMVAWLIFFLFFFFFLLRWLDARYSVSTNLIVRSLKHRWHQFCEANFLSWIISMYKLTVHKSIAQQYKYIMIQRNQLFFFLMCISKLFEKWNVLELCEIQNEPDLITQTFYRQLFARFVFVWRVSKIHNSRRPLSNSLTNFPSNFNDPNRESNFSCQ